MQKHFTSDQQIPVRIGIHLGEVFQDENSAYGDAINIASRIQSISSKGAILVSEAVKKAIGKQKNIVLEEIGREHLKNISRPIMLFSVVHSSVTKADKNSIHQNALKQNISKRKRWNQPELIFLMFILIITALSSYGLKNSHNKQIKDEVYKAKLAVMPFQNLTGIEADSIIGNMASKVIISGMKEVAGTNIISYSFLTEYRPKDMASIYKPGNVPKLSKAVNLIQGEIRKEHDSIMIHAFLINLQTGKNIHTFPEVRSAYDRPLEAIKKMEFAIKGYWLSKDLKPLSIPNHEASKFYMLALNAWFENDSLTLAYLDKSIQADSTFLDSYLMKLDFYYNLGENQLWSQWHQLIKEKFPIENLNERQQNTILYDEADIAGNNILAYQLYKKEFEYNPEELFNNTNMALLSLEYINDPSATLEVLNYLDPNDIDFHSCTYCLLRLDLEIRALLDLGHVQKAVELIDLYPFPIEQMKSNQLIIRALIMAKDTSRLKDQMKSMSLLMKEKQYAYLSYLAAKDAAIIGFDDLSKRFAQRALEYYQNEELASIKMEVHYLLQDYEAALQTSIARWEAFGHIYDKIQMAHYHALLGNKKKALEMISDLEKEPNLPPYGYTPYYLSQVYTALDYKQKAIMNLEQSILDGRKFNLNRFHWDAHLRQLHQDEQFNNVIHPIQH
jgi:TolB-like protein